MIDQVARDQDPFLGDEDHRVSGGVPRPGTDCTRRLPRSTSSQVERQGRREIAHLAASGPNSAATAALPAIACRQLLLLAVAQALAVVVRALGEPLAEHLAPARIPLEPSGIVSFDLLPRLRLRDDAQPGKASRYVLFPRVWS